MLASTVRSPGTGDQHALQVGFSQHGSWVPRGNIPRISVPKERMWKLLGQVKARPKASFIPYSIDQSNHKHKPDSRGEETGCVTYTCRMQRHWGHLRKLATAQ